VGVRRTTEERAAHASAAAPSVQTTVTTVSQQSDREVFEANHSGLLHDNSYAALWNSIDMDDADEKKDAEYVRRLRGVTQNRQLETDRHRRRRERASRIATRNRGFFRKCQEAARRGSAGVALRAGPVEPEAHVRTASSSSASEDETALEQANAELAGAIEEKLPAQPVEIIGTLDLRKNRVDFVGYDVDVLEFLGLWNDARYTEKDRRYCAHYGAHLSVETKIVQLPRPLVAELGTFWAFRSRHADFKEFLVSVVRCKELCKTMVLTAEQERIAVFYAPVIAYNIFWREQQDCWRLVDGNYFSFTGPSRTIKYNLSALRQLYMFLSQWRVFPYVASATLTVGLVLLYKLVQAFRVKSVAASPWSGAYALFGAPVIEEVFKRFVPGFKWVFPIVELFQYTQAGADPGLRIMIALMHYIWAALPLRTAVALHMLYNHAATRVFMIGSGTANSMGSTILAGLVSGVSIVSSLFSKQLPVVAQQPLVTAVVDKPVKLKESAKISFSGPRFVRNADLEPDVSRGVQHVLAFDSGLYKPNAYSSNRENERLALAHRALTETPKPFTVVVQDEEHYPVIDECVQFAKFHHKKLFRNVHDVQSLSSEAYLKGSNASPGVKAVLRRTFDKLREMGIDENSILTKAQLYQWTQRTAFVKVENNGYCSPAGVGQKAPRLISGAQPEFICLVGPWIAALQNLIKRRWNEKFFIAFTSGMRADKVAEFIHESEWLPLEDDVGKWDSSIRRPFCEYEVWLARKFGAPRAVLDLMTANISTHGKTTHGWKYKIDATRKSGDPYTSLFNSILNGITHLYLYHKFNWLRETTAEPFFVYSERVWHVLSQRVKMALQGDDNALVHFEHYHYPWKLGMQFLGFEAEAIYRNSFDELEFCSCRFYKVVDQYGVPAVTFGPKPGRVMAKLGVVIDPPRDVNPKSLLRGICLGLRAQVSFVPPIACVVERLLALTEGCEAYYLRANIEHSMRFSGPRKYFACAETYHALDVCYGWNHTFQSLFELRVSRMQLGDSYDDILADLLMDQDIAIPSLRVIHH
jgi:hypothetical protein